LPYGTLAGLILYKIGRFSELEEKTRWQNYELICEEVTPTSIVKVKLIAVDNEP